MLDAVHDFSEANGLQVTAMALRERVPEQLAGLLTASHPELRAAAVFTLGALVQVPTLLSTPNHCSLWAQPMPMVQLCGVLMGFDAINTILSCPMADYNCSCCSCTT